MATREATVLTARLLESRTQKVGRGSRVNMHTARLLEPHTQKVARGSTFESASYKTQMMVKADCREVVVVVCVLLVVHWLWSILAVFWQLRCVSL